MACATSGKARSPPPTSFDGLGNVQDIRRLIEIAILDTLGMANSMQRSRTLALSAAAASEVGPLPRPRPASPRSLGIGVLFEHVRDSVVVADPVDGRIILWSKSAESLFGYSQSEAVGLRVEALIPARMRDSHHLGMEHFRRTDTAHSSIPRPPWSCLPSERTVPRLPLK